ncbi:MAG: HD-GYP domain-containing protein [Spirochaetes bacterium]|nr:HD-GYP domain-containing protein [Spirochaetota bacterium]
MEQKYIAVRHDESLATQSRPDQVGYITKQYSADGIEVNKLTFAANDNFSLMPPRVSGSVKIYSLLSGEISCVETRQTYQSGSSFMLFDTHHPLNIHTREAGELVVYVLGEASFQMSADTSAKVHETMMAIQAKDEYTYNHCINVHNLVLRLVEPLGYSGYRVRQLIWAARYHDIGKIKISDHILNKPDSLDEQEYRIMQTHVEAGRDLIVEYFGQETFDIIAQHHERMDGSGYPLELKGDEIMEEARLLAICDAFDAMISDRVYKKAMSREQAFAELQALAGTHYDARLVDVFVRVIGGG